jgi:hypothetical protein
LSQTLELVTELAAKCGLVEVVDERAFPVDLDHRQPLAVARLELGIPTDVDLVELEAELVAEMPELPLCPFAQVAARSVIEDDASYGYSPRVIVASATR